MLRQQLPSHTSAGTTDHGCRASWVCLFAAVLTSTYVLAAGMLEG